MWITVVIWYIWYDKTIGNILSYQVINKNSIIIRTSVFAFVTVIIIFLTVLKCIVLLIQFTSIVAYTVVLLLVVFFIFVW